MISVQNASAGYRLTTGDIHAVSNVSLEVADFEILGIAGESGCGKSTLLKLLYGQIGSGVELFDGRINWRSKNRDVGIEDVKSLWWDEMTYIPQIVNILNPVARIGQQVLDSLPARLQKHGKAAVLAELTEFFSELGLPATVFASYPHQLSGGMLQRVLVGMATFSRPRLVLADEPTTALDVVSQKNILLLMRRLQRQQRNTLIIVSHDLGVHFQVTDRVAICYAGKIVEIGPTQKIFDSPCHPYTKGLIDALPRIDDTERRSGLSGRPPSIATPPSGCRFADRCMSASDVCRRKQPQSRQFGERVVACHNAAEP